MTKELSNTISWLRFPLAALIVYKHYYTPDISADAMSAVCGNCSAYAFLGMFITSVFTALPVPLFFLISGYLYFANVNTEAGFTLGLWKDKTKKRIKSLLVPYMAWNALVLLLYAGMQAISSGSDVMAKDGYKLISQYEAIDYLKAFYALDSTGLPMDGPLWFIRDLFITSTITPPLSY